MSRKIKCPVCSIEYDIRGFPTHYGTKHPVEFAKSIGSQPNTVTGVSLQDLAKIGELSDVVKAKDTQIAQLQDSLKKKETEFVTLHDEIAQLNSNEHQRDIVWDALRNHLTPESYEAIGVELGFKPKPQTAGTLGDPVATPEVKPETPATVKPEEIKPEVKAEQVDPYPFYEPGDKMKDVAGWTYFPPPLNYAVKD